MERLDVSYERVCMDIARESSFTNMLDSLLDDNEHQITPVSSKKLQEAVSRFMEYEEKYSKRNGINVTMDIFFQSPVTINTQRKYENVTNERRISLDIHA